MTQVESTSVSGSVGSLLQYWRKTRSLSQLALASAAEVSARHICFLETGRARPSREMVVLLSSVLEIPLRERNALLLAAGFAPAYGEAKLNAEELGPVRAALDAILRQQEPFPALVMSRHWDVLDANEAGRRFFRFFLGARSDAPSNVLRLMFDPNGLRPYVTNWNAVAEALVARAHREAVGGVADPATRRLLDEILTYADVPRRLHRPNLAAPLLPVLPICFRKDGEAFDFFSTVTTLGTPQDVTLQEIRIECFFPTTVETEARARAMASDTGA